MLTVTLQEFMALVEERRVSDSSAKSETSRRRVRVRRDEQVRAAASGNQRRLATCPQCDVVVDSEFIDPYSGLCPICHDQEPRLR